MRLLEVRGLVARYGDFQALHGIDFNLESGETVAVIGSNGAGKTTFLQTLSGLQPVTAGYINFAGQPLAGLAAHRIIGLGLALVPEGRRLFPSLSVEENLLIGAYAKRPGSWTLERIYCLVVLGLQAGLNPFLIVPIAGLNDLLSHQKRKRKLRGNQDSCR